MLEFMDYSDNPWSALVKVSGISPRMSLIGALHRFYTYREIFQLFFSANATEFTKKSLI